MIERVLPGIASAAWNSHTNRDTEIIEKVQRQAARFIAHDYMRSKNSQDLVNQFGWASLESRHAMLQPYSSVLTYSYSPFVRTVRVWNKLSTQTVQAKNITSFKSLKTIIPLAFMASDSEPIRTRKINC